MRNQIKKISTSLIFTGLVHFAAAQPSFVDYQKSNSRCADAFRRMEDTLKKQFTAKKLNWPPNYIYIRSFKIDRQFEVWAKNDRKEPYKLFKTYKVCMQSGTAGPKRMEGDYQVPEGFYYINEFNPNSHYHLSLGLNYPNASDRILSDSVRPGAEIYIHGNCASTGCIPIDDIPVEEVYILSSYAKSAGQEFIPVHVYPYKYNVKKSAEVFAETVKAKPHVQKFAQSLKPAFDQFEEKKQVPLIMVNRAGEYIVN